MFLRGATLAMLIWLDYNERTLCNSCGNKTLPSLNKYMRDHIAIPLSTGVCAEICNPEQFDNDSSLTYELDVYNQCILYLSITISIHLE